MKILLISAMQAELDGMLKITHFEYKQISGFEVYFTKINENDIYLAKCDVGKVNAAILTAILVSKIKPKLVLNYGIAGGLNNQTPVLSTVFATKCAYHDFDLSSLGYKKGELDNHQTFFMSSKTYLSKVPKDNIFGLIVSGDQFINNLDKLNLIKSIFPKALACDMEGCAVAHVCSVLKRKFLIVRTISDNPFAKEDSSNQYWDYKMSAIDENVKKVYNFLLLL